MPQRKPRSQLLASLMRCLDKAMGVQQAENPSGQLPRNFHQQRRDFLLHSTRAAAAMGLSTLLDSCQKLIETTETLSAKSRKTGLSETARIAIIGGGIAGLQASTVLQSKGVSSTIYEASTRIGGRIITGRNILGQGSYTEMGGEFIDSTHKDLLSLAKRLNLELLDTRPAQKDPLQYQAYYFNGMHYTEAQVINAFLPYARLIKSDQLKMSGLITANSYSAFDQLLDNLTLS
ncbi:MAG: FAD-dependent oxidoreductase, partial [Chitinophagaceae bacterium]